MKILSFVIPAYNSEKFLDICIPSMLHPDVIDRIEIIVVNDGSKDKTAEAAETYCRQYPDTVRLINQENRGHGGALNTGCAAARGKYLKVIDSDDWVVTENLPQLIAALEECDSDVVLTHYHTVNITTGEIKPWCSSPADFKKAYTFDTIMQNWHSFDQVLTFHGITYRTDFYQRINHVLVEHVFYEDHEYATYPCCYAAGITPLDLFVYEYRIGDVQQSVSLTNQLKRIGHLETVLQRMLEVYKKIQPSSGKKYAAVKAKGVLLSYLTTALLVNPNKKEGRKLAQQRMQACKEAAPEVYRLAERKFRVLCLLNRLHVSKNMWDCIVSSSVYAGLRKLRLFI